MSLLPSLAVGRTDGKHTELHFYHSVFVFLVKKKNTHSMAMEIGVKLQVNPDSAIMWHPWGNQFSTSDRNEGNRIGKAEIISMKFLAAGQAGKVLLVFSRHKEIKVWQL